MISKPLLFRAVVLAFAVPLIFLNPAQAKSESQADERSFHSVEKAGGPSDKWARPVSHRHGYSGPYYGPGPYGQPYQETRHLRRRAVKACRRAIRQSARHQGFRSVSFYGGRHVDQIGPRGFFVSFRGVEFEGRRRIWDRPVYCKVRRGDIVRRLEGIPERYRPAYDRPRHGRRG